MKKIYERPQMMVEEYEANEYVAACGDSGTTYKFECTSEAGTLYYYPNAPISPGGSWYSSGSARSLGNYHPCGATTDESHYASNYFYAGFVDRNRNRKCDEGEKVIVWRGTYNNNGHATDKLETSSWEIARS